MCADDASTTARYSAPRRGLKGRSNQIFDRFAIEITRKPTRVSGIRSRLIRLSSKPIALATNKNQHFVPRCYLRPFTSREEDKTICLFNVDLLRAIPNASVRHQCAKSYFYGRNAKLEKAIQFVEQSYSSISHEIRAPGHTLRARDKIVLQRFLLLQNLRTEAASRRAVEMAACSDSVLGVEALSFRFGVHEAVQLAMRTYADHMSAIDDLKVCLLRNRTRIPFITSDNPAVITNRWYLQDRRIVGRSFGMSASGLLALLPITPQILCVAYDGDVYTLPNQGGWAELRRESDVEAFNEHQFLNCFANVFVHQEEQLPLVASSYEACARLRPTDRFRAHYAQLAGQSEGYSRYEVISSDKIDRTQEGLLHTEAIFPKPSRWPSVVQRRANGNVYTNGTGAKYVRRSWIDNYRSGRPFWRERA